METIKNLSWDKVELAISEAVEGGLIADWRTKLPMNRYKKFRARKTPNDILGCCTHHGASKNQDPVQTANYHVGPNHINSTGCPGINYSAGISQDVEPDKVILFHDFQTVPYSQGANGDECDYNSGDENRHLYSVLVFGDFDETDRLGKSVQPSPSQINRWRWFTRWLESIFGFNGLGYFGHYHFGKVHCPGRNLRKQIECRREGSVGLWGDLAWQKALLAWNENCLPKYGADGDWGYESKRALVRFEQCHKHKADGIQDPFTELLLLKKYYQIP